MEVCQSKLVSTIVYSNFKILVCSYLGPASFIGYQQSKPSIKGKRHVAVESQIK
jgi:hypothetical protein